MNTRQMEQIKILGLMLATAMVFGACNPGNAEETTS